MKEVTVRSDYDLIQLILDNFDEYFERSLCFTLTNLLYNKIIDDNEISRLDRIIHKNIRPKNWLTKILFDKRRLSTSIGYFWNADLRYPRRQYLQYLLEKYKNKGTNIQHYTKRDKKRV